MRARRCERAAAGGPDRGTGPGQPSKADLVCGLFSLLVLDSDAMNDLDPLVQAAHADFARAATPAELENAKARYLGKAGRVTELLKALGALAADEKKARGAADQRRQAAHRGRAARAPRGAGRGRTRSAS